MTAVIDTHALLWWFKSPSWLSPVATQQFAEWELGNGTALVNAVSLWELETKRLRGRLKIPTPVGMWLEHLGKIPWLKLVDTTSEVWIRSAQLEWNHRDPADRIIAATALVHQVPVITKDREYHAADSPVKAIW